MTIDLTILTYNIHHGEGMDGVVDLQRISDVIMSAAPDLVAVQEVDRYKTRTGRVDQVAELAHLTGMTAEFSISIDVENDGQYGNMVLSRFPVVRTKTYSLPGEPRSLLAAHIKIPHEPAGFDSLMFYVTHLDLEQKHRLQSIRKIRKIVTSIPGRSAILAGDLNAQPDSLTIVRLLEFWRDATADESLMTCDGTTGQNPKQIDYIMVRPGQQWTVLETRVLDAPVASDHYPLLARMRYKG